MYAYNRSSEAYDFSTFDTAVRKEQKPQSKAQEEKHIELHKTSVAKSGAWFKTAIFISVAVVVALMFVTAKATLSELSAEINDATSLLEEAKRENIRLQTELDNMVTLSKVDEMATSSLGLQKTTKMQVKYITVHDRTMVQCAEADTNPFARLKNWLDDTAEYLGF